LKISDFRLQIESSQDLTTLKARSCNGLAQI